MINQYIQPQQCSPTHMNSVTEVSSVRDNEWLQLCFVVLLIDRNGSSRSAVIDNSMIGSHTVDHHTPHTILRFER